MSKVAGERLRAVVRAYTEAVKPVRALDTSFHEDDPEELLSAKNAIGWLDMGLVCPHFFGRVILTHTPEVAEAPAIEAALDDLEKLNAIPRSAAVVSTIREHGFGAAEGTARELGRELRLWAEASLELAELQGALAAYRADPSIVNRQRLTL